MDALGCPCISTKCSCVSSVADHLSADWQARRRKCILQPALTSLINVCLIPKPDMSQLPIGSRRPSLCPGVRSIIRQKRHPRISRNEAAGVHHFWQKDRRPRLASRSQPRLTVLGCLLTSSSSPPSLRARHQHGFCDGIHPDHPIAPIQRLKRPCDLSKQPAFHSAWPARSQADGNPPPIREE